jgi:Ulp1 family protease
VKWRHGRILCNGNSAETAASPPTATTENVDSLNTAGPSNTRAKRKYTKSAEISHPSKKQQKRISKKNTTIDLVQDDGSEISSSPSSSESPHSLDSNTLIIDEAHQALGLDAVEAATVLTLLKRS